MSLAEGVFFGVLAFLSWGFADFLAKKLVSKIGGFNALLFEQMFAILLLTPFVLLFGNINLITWEMIPILILTAAAWTYPYLSFYKGLEKGMLSVITPIGSTWGAGGAVLAAVILNETLSIMQWTSVAIIAIGIFLVSLQWTDLKKLTPKKLVGVEWAILALIGWSFSAVLMKPVVLGLGPIVAIWLIKILSVPMTLSVLPITKYKLRVPTKFWKLVITIATIDVIAFLGYNFGITTGQVGIVGPISAAFPIVTVTMAWLFLKERLTTSQLIGVTLAISGMIALSML